jgi:Protein of unknown function (DUF429)
VGWPRAFVEALKHHQAGDHWLTDPQSPSLRLRRTDREVGSRDRIWPLSISTDRISIVAFRAARLLPLLGKCDSPSRDGASGIIEVYPAAALKRWGLPFRQYKRATRAHAAIRRSIRDSLVDRFDLDLGGHAAALEGSADDLDAVVAAIIGREYASWRTEPIPPDAADVAREEGWIHLPA